MTKEPWLAGLDEDWVSQPSSPCSLRHSPTLPTSGHQHSARKCIGCSERSRIPKPPPAASPKVRGKITPRAARQSQIRRGGSTTPISTRTSPSPRQTPSPRTARTSISPSKPSPKSNGKQPTPARKKPSSTPLKNVMSVKSTSSIASVRTEDQGTIQIRASKEDTQETPEWKRRLVRGEMSADEQCDLFAPIGLENIFRQPTTAATTDARSSLTVVNHPSNEAKAQVVGTMAQKSVQHRVSFKHDHEKGNHQEQSTHLNVHMTSSKHAKFGLDGVVDTDIRLRSASGEEELRNEDLTPIFLSASNNTVDRRTGSGILQSALRQLNGISDSPENDGMKEHQGNGEVSSFQPNELLGVSSPFMPEDLSTGTEEEAMQTQPFVTFERGGYSEGSFRLQQLSPSSFPSHLQSSVLTDSKIRSSPPASNQDDIPQSPQNSIAVPAITFSPTGGPDSERPQTANMSSPLKLFGNHDTFTNKKLLRRMSQFEETYQDISEDDEPASPSLVARRMRTAKRSLPNLRRGQSQSHRASARPVTQDAVDPRMNRFGYGQLDEFGFANRLIEPSTIPSLSFEHTDLHEHQQGRRLLSQNVRNENLRKAKSFDDLPENKSSIRALQRRISRRSGSRQSSLGIYYQSNANVRRVTHMSSRTTAPKRRRTIQQTEEQALDATELIDSILNLSLEDRATRHQSQTSDHLSHAIQGAQNSEQTRNRWNRVTSENALSISDESKEDVLGLDGHKRSLTTQDFLDEATKVMSIIRAKSKYKNGLASVEESDVTGLDEEEDERLTDVSSRENLSRPPSREGVDMRKFREPRPLHPRVVSHLKKFADKEDTEQLMASVMSDLCKEQHSVTCERTDYSKLSGETMSSLQNVRILPRRKRKHSDDDPPMHSIPTISSNGSNTKGVIASDMVSHLIPEHVNGMNYDKANKSWVKQRIGRAAGVIRSEDSEDDPFGSIPDLSVDELEEIKRVQESASPSKSIEEVNNRQIVRANPEEETAFAGAQRPATRDGAPFVPDSSSVQSKTTRFTSSGPQPETRATSWGTEDMTVNINQISSPNSTKPKIRTTLQQGHIGVQSKQPKGSGAKRVSTISFSSPLVSHISYADDIEYAKTTGMSADEQHGEHQVDSKSVTVAPSRRTSFDGRPFIGRPISRIDEQNEDSVVEMRLDRRNSTGQLASTPPSHLLEKSIVYPSSAGGDNYSFYLSPLADFTVNQTDDPKHPELSYVAQRAHPTALRQIHGTFSLATEDLIRHITDVEPTEIYWEHLRRLSLRDKGIITLHCLDKFCPRLEGLDVSENELGQLDGAPSTLRDLRVQHNCLTNMTAWGHLINLQYLDVSGNQLESLDGFSGIRNIKGIFGLNGLLRLELKHNNLTTVDFEGSELTRLGEIDFSSNQINAIQHLEYLPAMETLDVSANQLRELQTPEPLRSLRTLKASSNRLSAFDASHYPKLQLLYLDNNYLTTVFGLSGCSGIEVFSVREQFAGQSPELGASLDIDLGSLNDTRKIFLSSNRLSERTLAPSVPLLALQLLDIASCGIQRLPNNFDKKFPNLRVLNLNSNCVSDLGGIVNMKGLSRLTVAGNRINRLRTLCQVVARVGRSSQHGYSSLKTIDLRNNPLTVGFYPPQVSGSGRADSHLKMIEDKLQRAQKRQRRIETGVDLIATTSEETEDHAVIGFASKVHGGGRAGEVEIDDPYTLPPADAETDRKYRSRLDASTKTKRITAEVMLYAGTGGSLRVLNGLDLRPVLEDERAEVDRIWDKLEQLGVFTKRNTRALCQ
ncbi:hypothetical protein UA08_07211 [Talaromyces atroroseus]|uniref:Septation initiation network scaffold protein cdc11 n=1 Tax=Talaromyces atroroseus TaxID=1441469 RepID=A0A225AEZ6_TALAT|nr:hypothetical protein UA08_07211 [Talaromyces atroroseus]OKL57663.1 hypothetical protein UA08_07211 [Talaromyces atroroseus]